MRRRRRARRRHLLHRPVNERAELFFFRRLRVRLRHDTRVGAAAVRLDASKLKAKDLLVLHIQPGSEEILLTLDGYKLMNFRALVKILETHVPQDRQTI